MEEKKNLEKKSSFPFTDSGVPVAYKYQRVFDEESGRNILKVADKYDIEERIQASSNLSDIAIIKDRYKTLGEIPDLPQRGISGIDTSKIPTDIHQLYKIISGAGAAFDKLPDDLKAAYGSKQKYLDAIVDGTAGQVLGKYIKSKAKKPDLKKEEGDVK